MKKHGLLYALIILVLVACEELKSYPTVPEIEFKDYKVDVLVNEDEQILYQVFFRFSLTDGDGNFGLGQGDTLGVFAPGEPYNANLFINKYNKEGDKFVKEIPKAPYNKRILNLEPQGQNKTLIADVESGVDLFKSQNQGYDTLIFEFHVVDRDLNHSDTLFTCKIPFREQTDGYIPLPPKPTNNQ